MTEGRYVDYGGLATAPGPLDCHGATLWAFWVSADDERLRELLARVFDEPTAGAVRCAPLFGAVMVTFGVIDRIVARTPEYSELGHVTERQVGLWVPTVVRASAPASPEGEHFAMFVAAMWLDNPLSIASGREVYGYPKHWGWPRLPEEDGPQRPALDAFAWDFGPDEQPGRREDFIVADPVGATEVEAQEREGSLAALAKEIATELPVVADPEGIGLLRRLAETMTRGEMPMILLRQFRSPAGGTAADVRQVVLAPARPRELRFRRLGRHEISMRRFDSHPLREQLGLRDRQRALLAHRVRMDFKVEVGKVLWSAGR